MIKVGILTVSDKGARGERVDKSGPAVREIVSRLDVAVVRYEIVPDEIEIIAAKLNDWADGGEVDVLFTTGGTGLATRDVTPEATLAVIDREVPGIVEAVRAKSREKTPLAMLSRAVSGLRGRCLIINLPGSPQAVRECLEIILPAVPHAVKIIRGEVTEHTVGMPGQVG
ncbi:MAG: molybdenum cofactor biosynthesis protein [Chloroflexi bacterium RBG_16_56_11]|nr:MAG: molybdenum cofactor biosynthesis protein [Chloroflexi bacterium RBG_16_56_11]